MKTYATTIIFVTGTPRNPSWFVRTTKNEIPRDLNAAICKALQMGYAEHDDICASIVISVKDVETGQDVNYNILNEGSFTPYYEEDHWTCNHAGYEDVCGACGQIL